MFLRFCVEKEEIHVVRDDQIIVDILYVKPDDKGVILYNRKTYDGEEVWETLTIVFVKEGNKKYFLCENEERFDREIWSICDDEDFIRMTRLLAEVMFVASSMEFFDSRNLKLVNSSCEKGV